MTTLSLPDPDASLTTSLHDAAEAQTWLTTQPQAQPMRLLRALLHEVRSVDACISSAATRLEILDALRPSIVLAQSGAYVRYATKPLPLIDDELNAFDQARQLWHQLAVAYLRAVPMLAAAPLAQALHRAAVSLRELLRCHYVAGIEAGPEIQRLLYEILTHAETKNVQRTPVSDPAFPHLGDSTIAGDVAWSLLLHATDPYRFTPAQFAVANRALSRWSDLANFQGQPDEDPKAKPIPISRWLGDDPIPEGGPKWLEVRPVIRKIRRRVEALEAGESPEQLKLGRELTASACIRLMRELDGALRPRPKRIGDRLEPVTVDLVFGNENLYALISGKRLAPPITVNQGNAISYERMVVFGFDNIATRADHAGKMDIPSETWAVEDDWILRAGPAGGQVTSPLLVGVRPEKEEAPRLAVLVGLRQTADGWLAARLRYLPPPMGCGVQATGIIGSAKGGNRFPAFLLPADEKSGVPVSVCLPTGSGVREGSLLALEDSPVEHLRLAESLERGSNFTRFAYKRN